MPTGRYWETEAPIVINTEKNIMRLYPMAGKLQVAMPNWIDEGGVERPGKTVTLDIEALALSPDRDIAMRVLMLIYQVLEGSA